MAETFPNLTMNIKGGIASGPQADTAISTSAAGIVSSGHLNPWTEFDRKYLIWPPLDCSLAYPVAPKDLDWTTQW